MDDRTDRSLIAEIAANMRWARTTPDERRQATATAREAGRAALLLRFENEVDPDRVLDEIERTKRVRNLVSAHMAQMAREGAARRRTRRAEKLRTEVNEALAEIAPEGGAA